VAKVWVLDTETKGTGANIVPLEKKLERPAPAKRTPAPPRKRVPRPPKPREPRPPHRFKVVDLMTQRTLAEHVDARATAAVLEDVASVVDVHIFVWEPKHERWRLLTLGEQKAFWELRGQRRGEGSPVTRPSM
jgi:hypothetical protein